MKHRVTIEIPFEAAHRLMNHPGKCQHLHGHSYRAFVVVGSEFLPPNGMVVDFGDLKSTIGWWVDSNWDHNILLHWEDPLNKLYFNRGNVTVMQAQVDLSNEIFRGKMPHTFPDPPTAEVLAQALCVVARNALKILLHHEHAKIISVTVHETVKCSASYFPEIKK